jgi:hypothetical protein
MGLRIRKTVWKWLAVGALAPLVVVGVVQGIQNGQQDAKNFHPYQPSPQVYHTELPGEQGYLEYWRSLHVSTDKAVSAGYATCSDLDLGGVDFTYSEMRQVGDKEKSDRLLYASVHYLCPSWEPAYEAWKVNNP